MSKALPYFRWYPADAETDKNFRAMDDADLGFYMRCLNHAWINGGVPADPAERARVLRTRLDTANRRWDRVGKCFVTSTSHPELLINPRQEEERILASQKSLKCSESAKARSERSSDDVPRARARADSGSPASSVFEVKEEVIEFPKRPGPPVVNASSRGRFDEWIAPWGRVPNPERALHAWCFCVTPENEILAFACRDRYLASKDAGEGVWPNPENFLNEQYRNGWKGKWPARAPPAPAAKTNSLVDRTVALWEKRIAKGESPL